MPTKSTLALSLEGYDATTAALRRDLIIGGLIIVLLESAMAWLLASRLVRPLTKMAATANQIAHGALDTEVQHAGGSREVFDLSSDIERMVARLRAALAEREKSDAAATQARDDMRQFLADVSRGIRTPLTALKGYSDLYERGMLEAPGALERAMSRVGNESVRLHRLVNSMMEVVRGGERHALEVADIDVTQVVREVVDDLRAAYPDRRIDLQIGQLTDSTVVGDPARIHQAVLNLGANACTTHPPPRRSSSASSRRRVLSRSASSTTAPGSMIRSGSGSSCLSTKQTRPELDTATAEPASASQSPSRSRTSITGRSVSNRLQVADRPSPFASRSSIARPPPSGDPGLGRGRSGLPRHLTHPRLRMVRRSMRARDAHRTRRPVTASGQVRREWSRTTDPDDLDEEFQ